MVYMKNVDVFSRIRKSDNCYSIDLSAYFSHTILVCISVPMSSFFFP